MATNGKTAWGYQTRIAESGLPDVLRVPTGSGKTLAAVLPWLYRRTAHPDPAVRADTPHWLVVVLPQRSLVEQTVRTVREWLGRLESPVPVHVLMGGEDDQDREWKIDPTRERIFVGTQDMVLSRLLMRGFAEGRNVWPMSFGFLHAGVQFVFDEIQLMGPGLPTSLQLAAFRERLGTAAECRSMWMSATVNLDRLRTVDFRRDLSVSELDERDRTGVLGERLAATRVVGRLDLPGEARRYPKALAEQVRRLHRRGTRTLVVVNTVDRAVAVADALAELINKNKDDTPVRLLHSRFRPPDRRDHTDRALAAPGPAGLIVVSTQVLEAGVDTTSATLVTETAPWSSIVQRAGRCNRYAETPDARLWWTPPPGGSAAPYPAEDLAATEQALAALDGVAVTGERLAAAGPAETEPTHPVLRLRDLMDLLDTSPDLDGSDIDVSPYIRDADDRTVFVAWRPRPETEQPDTWPRAVGRDELCPAPIGAVRDLLKERGRAAWVFDEGPVRWRRADRDDVRPTAVIVFDAAAGGYRADVGFAPDSHAPVTAVATPDDPADAVDSDPSAIGYGRWVPLAEHLSDVERWVRDLLARWGDLPGLTADQREAVAIAGRYHDLGKAHPVFQEALAKANPDQPAPEPDRVWAKSPGHQRLHYGRKHFRHELVSALLLLDPDSGLLDSAAEPDLVSYLILAHHGKARVSVRAKPDEPADRILGVADGDTTLDAGLPGGTVLAARSVSLAAARFGEGSVTERALALRDRPDLGPFTLAFCEALLRSADWAASAADGGRGA